MAIDHKAPVYLFTRARLHRWYTQSVRGLGSRLSPPGANRRPTFRLWYSARYHRRRLIIITDEGRGGEGLPARVNREILPLESFHLESLFSRVHQSPAYCVPSSFDESWRKGERNEENIGDGNVFDSRFGINMSCVSSFPWNYPSFCFRNFGNSSRVVIAQQNVFHSSRQHGKIWNGLRCAFWNIISQKLFVEICSRRIICYFKNNHFLSDPEKFSQVVSSLKRKRIVMCEEISIQNLQDFIIKI